MRNQLIATTLLVTATATATATATIAAERPNILVLFVDDLGWADLGYNNSRFDTPNINRLKSDGLYLSRTYVPTPTSSPSRATLLTGREALRCGLVRHIYDNEDVSSEFQMLESDPRQMKSRSWLPLEEITYAERLKEAGYYNYFIGKWHLGPEGYFPTEQGFDATYGTCRYGHPKSYYQQFFKSNNPMPDASDDDYLTDLITDGAVDFLESYNRKEPFLLNLWYYTVHSPHIGRKDLVEHYLEKGYGAKEAEYAAMVSSLDTSVGRIRAALKESGLDENTVILFTSDQGGFFTNGDLRGGKRGGDTLAEGGARVPMIIYYPNAESMGSEYSGAIQTIDVYPTLVEIATGQKCSDKQINGVSLMPLIKGGELAERDLFFFRSYEDQNSAIMRDNWKLIRYYSGKVELYNLTSDPTESQNLATQEPTRTKKMLNSLLKWEREATPKELLK